MTRYDCDHRQHAWQHAKGWGSFMPNGALQVHGPKEVFENPRRWSAGKYTYAGRLIVGFKRQGKRPATLNQLVKIVRSVRQRQVGNPSSSFLLQRGLYKHSGTGEVVDEPGAQVIVINTFGASKAEFEKQMVEVAETVAKELDQEKVILEIQRNGISQATYGIGP